MLLFRLVSVIIKIIIQCNVDLFFVDWEAPKPYLNFKVPLWRSVFLANEFNELQVQMRYVSPMTTLIWAAFFIRGLGFENLAKADPDMNKDVNGMEPTNYVLLFFLTSFIFLVIGATQYLL